MPMLLHTGQKPKSPKHHPMAMLIAFSMAVAHLHATRVSSLTATTIPNYLWKAFAPGDADEPADVTLVEIPGFAENEAGQLGLEQQVSTDPEKAKEAIFYEYRISNTETFSITKRFTDEVELILKQYPHIVDHKSSLSQSDTHACYRLIVYYLDVKKKVDIRQKVAFRLGELARDLGIQIALMEQRTDDGAKVSSARYLSAKCQSRNYSLQLPVPQSTRPDSIRGHPTRLRIPYSCDVENCEVGGCAREKIGHTMVRLEPAGPKYIFSNPAWGGVHVTITGFSKYEDPVGMFESMRASLGPEYNVPWHPHTPHIMPKMCKGENTTRLDFKSELLEDIAQRLKDVGFKSKFGHRHISIESGREYQFIVDAIGKEETHWNLVLLGVEGGEVVKLATMGLKGRKLNGRDRVYDAPENAIKP